MTRVLPPEAARETKYHWIAVSNVADVILPVRFYSFGSGFWLLDNRFYSPEEAFIFGWRYHASAPIPAVPTA